MDLFPWFLFAHILGAIIAFGPAFSHRFIGAMGGAEPQHRNFALRVSEKLAGTQTLPLAIVQGVTGLGLIFTGNIDFGAAVWLQTAIVLYVIVVAYALGIQTPAVKKLIEMTAGGPPPAGAAQGGPPPAWAAQGGPPPAGAAQGGPPPAVVALVKKVQRGGMLLAVLVVTIVFLMVVKPAF